MSRPSGSQKRARWDNTAVKIETLSSHGVSVVANGGVGQSAGSKVHYLNHPRDIVKHMSLRSLAMDGRGGQSAVRHVCDSYCQGKHPA